jgi:hypothetical protein
MLLFVLILSACRHSEKQASVKPPAKTLSPITGCDSLDKVTNANDKDTIFLNHDKGDSFWLTRSHLKYLLKKYPELGDTSIVLGPDETYAICIGRAKSDPCNPNEFDCEVCRDFFFKLYAYILKQHNGDKNYRGKRDTLTRLYNNIVKIYQISNGGGIGHMYRRISGYSEYAIYRGMDNEYYQRTYDISRQKQLYISSLKQLINDELRSTYGILEKDKPGLKKQLFETVRHIDGLITNFYYLKMTQEFQYSNY